MGRLGPLTSLALGRSPYDDIVYGEGTPDPRAPPQRYDERGRPFNPETRRINKDVIRSHNEVMLVIGVAEAENDSSDAQAESARKHERYEQKVGEVMYYVGRAVEAVGVWGVNGMRHRILIYKPYSFVPFMALWRAQQAQGVTLGSYLWRGLPCFFTSGLLRETLAHHSQVAKFGQFAPLTIYFIRHMEVFTFFQRMGLLPSWPWLPGPSFFIPGTASSPMALPSIPDQFTTESIAAWLLGAAKGIAPFVSFYLVSRAYGQAVRLVMSQIWPVLPKPKSIRTRAASHRRRLARDSTVVRAPENVENVPAMPPQAATGDEPRNGRDLARDEPTMRALEGQTTSDQPTVGMLRRQSTLSARGDDFGSDDEETEIVSATLISFDVEATDTTDTPPGVWSAELRPNVADARPAQEPKYRDNELTRLPAIRAMQLLGLPICRILIAPIEAVALRALARSYAVRHGLSTAAMFGVSYFGEFSWMGLTNMICLELAHVLFFQADMFALVIEFAGQFRMNEEEWNEIQAEIRAEEE